MKTTVYSHLGTSLDGGFKEKRWDRWRPNVGIGISDEIEVHTLVLLHGAKHKALAEQVAEDAMQAANRLSFQVRLKEVEMDPFDLPSTFLMMCKLRDEEVFDPEARYLLNLSTGTHMMQLACFKMIESGRWPGILAQCGPGEGIKSRIQLIDLSMKAYDPVMQRYRAENLHGEESLKQGIITQNEAFNQMVSKLQRVVTRTRSSILLTGPTGAGKTAMARRLFAVKQQKGLVQGELVEVNCATLRGDTVMSTLFGHKKGAFTGANDTRDGLLKRADNGVLFLDEIGTLSLAEQAMLLHALEYGVFTPLGSDRSVSSDFQLIAGTNENLPDLVRRGLFRADLLARIDTWSFTLPGLKDRREDIEPNLHYELDKAGDAHDVRYRFDERAKKEYLAFACSAPATWSGNFRDLASSVERMTTLCDDGVIDLDVVSDEIRYLERLWAVGSAQDSRGLGDVDLIAKVLPSAEMNALDRAQLNAVLELCVDAKSYADLGRKIFGGGGGSNPSQRIRNFLKGYGLTLEGIKADLVE